MKRLLSCFLLALLFSLGISVNVETSGFEKGERCKVKISVDDKSIDLSSVVLDVYSAECTYSEPGVGTYYYSDYYNNSLNFDLNGSVSVEKPSENFLVSVKLDTLPDGYGVCPNSYFFRNGIDEFTFELKRISSIDINHGDSYSVDRACDVDMDVTTCFDENGQFIFANPKIIKRDFVLLNRSCITNDAEKDLSLEYVYNVKVGGKEYLVKKQYSLRCPNKAAKAESLFKLGIIYEHEYMNTLASFMLYGDQYMDEDNIIECGTSFYMMLYDYREKHNDRRTDYSLIDKALNRSNEFQKNTRSLTYMDSVRGKILDILTLLMRRLSI